MSYELGIMLLSEAKKTLGLVLDYLMRSYTNVNECRLFKVRSASERLYHSCAEM